MATAPLRNGVEYLPTGLRFPAGRMPFDSWRETLRGLGAMAHGHQWWIGDALVEGERQYGEEAAQGEHDLGIPAQTQLNWRWVASRIELSRRREELTWSHHAEVARLDPDTQDALLERAIEESLGVRQLRTVVDLEHPRGDAPEPAPAPERLDALTDADLAAIARRLETLQASVEEWEEAGRRPELLHDHVDGTDVRWLLRTLRWFTRGGEKP